MFKNRIYGERFTNIGMIFRPADCAWGKRALLLFASFAFGLTAAFAAATPFEKMSANPLPDISGAGFANAPSPQKGFPISGSVVDEDGNPVSGVTVVEKANPANGTVSNSNGEFSIHVPDQNSVLAFSFLGYEPQELVVGDRRILSIMLKTAAQEMEDVVVVGFGTQKKESLVSAIATVKPSAICELSPLSCSASLTFNASICSLRRSYVPRTIISLFLIHSYIFLRSVNTSNDGGNSPI